MKKENKSLDQMAQQFTSIEELQAYSEAQYKTILSLNEKINQQQKEIESLKSEKNKLVQTQVVTSSVPDGSKFKVTDEETVCVIQIALLKNNALERELTMDETKRLEIYVKTLNLIRGKVEQPKKERDTSKMSTAELLALAEEEASKEPQ